MSRMPTDLNAIRKRVLPRPLDEISPAAESFEGEPRERLHEFFWNEILRARRKLDREQCERDWATYRRIKAYKGAYANWNFIVPPVNDKIDEIIGERPDVLVEARKESDQRVESQCQALQANAAEQPGHVTTEREIVDDAGWLGIGWGARKWEQDQFPDTPGMQDLVSDIERQEQAKIEGEEIVMAETMQPLDIAPDDVHWLHIERHKQALLMAFNLEHTQALQQHIDLHESVYAATTKSGSKLSRIRPEDMIYDPDARCWDDVLWCAERSVEFLDDVIRNPDYKNASSRADIAADPGYLDKEADDNSREPYQGDDGGVEMEVVEVYRIFDRRGGKVWGNPKYNGPRLIIISPNQVNRLPLNVLPWPYRGNIYKPLVLLEAKDRIEGVSMARVAMNAHDKLVTINNARVMAAEKMPKSRGIINKRYFTPSERDKFLNGDIDFLFTENDIPADAFIEVRPQTLNPDIFSAENAITAYINRALRSAEVAQGVEGGAKFATEIDALTAARGRGVQILQKRVAEWMVWQWETFFKQMHDFATSELLVTATGGVALDINVLQAKEIPLDLRITVDTDTFAAYNRELQKKQFREFLQFIFVETGGIFLSMLTPQAVTQIMTRALKLFHFKDPENMVKALDDQGHSMLIGMLQNVGAPQQPGPDGTPPMTEPRGETIGEMTNQAMQV